MTTRDEIEGMKRRIGGLEAELVDLKYRLTALEAREGFTSGEATVETQATGEESREVAAALESSPVEGVAARAEPWQAEVPPVLPRMEVQADLATQAGAESAGRRGKSLREWLEPLQLWPPSGEENAEVRLGAWWATRIGALLAVIGIVFLGIYVSRDASPWLRLIEVMVVTAGVIGLGAWLERRLPKFGAVLFGAGLALAYFCAFAAYAVGPMKVINSAAVATACELAVVAGILAVAWRRGSQVVATMAVALGHVTAFLALRGGPAGYGPWVVLVLGAAAVLLRIARNWTAPSAVAMPLAWAFLAVAATAGSPGLAMPLHAAWLWTVLYFALYFARDWTVALRGGELDRLDRTVQVANSGLSFAVGLFVTAQVGGSALTRFYFGAGVVMLLATLAWRRVGSGQSLVPIFACKTAGLVALGVISAWEGHARSLVLLAQAFAMLVSARQSSVRGLKMATALVGAVALAFFVGELRPENSLVTERVTLVELAFLAGAVGFVAALRRWLNFDQTATAFGSVVLGVVAVATLQTWHARGWEPAVGVGLAVTLAAVAAALRSWLTAAVIGSMTLLASHVMIWGLEAAKVSRGQLWGNELALLLGAAVGACGVARWQNEVGRRRANGFLALLAAGTGVVVCFKAFAATQALAVAAGVAAGFVALASFARNWPLAALSPLPFGLGFALFVMRGGRGPDEWLWVTMALSWLAPAWLVASRERWESIRAVEWRTAMPSLLTLLATIATVVAVTENFSGEVRVGVMAAAGVGVFALTWRPGLRPALEASWILWALVAAWVAERGAGALGWMAFALSWVPALVLAQREKLGELAPQPPRWRAWSEGIQVTLATAIGLGVALALQSGFGAARIGGLGVVALTTYAAWRSGRVAAAQTATVFVMAIGWIVAWLFSLTSAAQGWGLGLGAVEATGVTVSALPFFVASDQPAARQRWARWLCAALGLALVFLVFAKQRGTVADYATVGWGVAAVVTFLAGLFARSRPHRLVGLAGLALCVPRAFAVDLNSTLHRIVAFVALGVVLLWVGFSYHRFRHLIVDDEKKL